MKFGIMTMFYYLFVFIFFGLLNSLVKSEKQPNIIIIIADDMGSYDVSYRGSNQFTTPNIDALAYNGVILNRHYTGPFCSPSRASLLTGQYAARIGLQGLPIKAGQDTHLPDGVKTLPQHLKELGYDTHLVGKWHLGSARRKNTPLGKGFDSFFGYWNGYVGYHNYKINSTTPSNKIFRGFDLKENFRDAWEHQGRYATTLFTEKTMEIIERHENKTPMFLMVTHLAVHTGENEIVEIEDEQGMNQRFGYIEDIERRRYVEATYQLDQSVGKIVQKLSEQNMLRNSVIVFLSDNGAQITGKFHNGGSNFPYKGQKRTLNEGGVRNIGLLYSPLLKARNYVNDGLIHISDWLPTLYNLAGGNVTTLGKLDGVDQWKSISENIPSNREETLINIDELGSYSAILDYRGRYKLINGTISNENLEIYGSQPLQYKDENYNFQAILTSPVNKALNKLNTEQNRLNETIIRKIRGISSVKYTEKCKNENARENPKPCKDFCLFDLKMDPCETENLINEESLLKVANRLKNRLSELWKEIRPQDGKQQVDLDSNPDKYNGTWCTWLDDENCVKTH